MRTLDETDFEILRLLSADARRSYREIADAVGLSSPAVSDRVARLRELGVIRRFTLDLDRSMLREGVPTLVELSVRPDAGEAIHATLARAEGVEHVFLAAEPRVFFQSRLPGADVRAFLTRTFAPEELDSITDYEVTVLSKADWTPEVDGTDLALRCAECSNTVTEDGESRRLDGELYHFCCPSCAERFEARHDEFSANA